jgi:hypothetical protein
MQKPFDRGGDAPSEIRAISEAIINLYAAHVNSHLYPHDHPLVSDSLRNAHQCLQKIFRKKTRINLKIFQGGVTIDGEPLDSDVPVFANFAAWLIDRNVVSLSFTEDLTRREIINFHRIMSVKRPTLEELLKEVSDRNIINIIVHPPDEETEAGYRFLPNNAACTWPAEDSAGAMFHAEVPPGEPPPGADFAGTLLIGNEYDNGTGQDGSAAPFDPVPPKEMLHAGDFHSMVESSVPAEDPGYGRYLELLLERDVSEDEKNIIRGIPPADMADLLNAMFYIGVPGEDVLDRITGVYFDGEMTMERCGPFVERLKPSLKSSFRTLYSPLITDGELSPEEGMALSGSPASELEPSVLPPRRRFTDSGFAFDLIAEDKAVFHDIEIDRDTASFFDEKPGRKEEEIFLADASPGNSDAGLPLAVMNEECSDDKILIYSFEVMLELIQSDCLDGETYRRLSGKVLGMVGHFAERGDFENVLSVFNCLRTRSLQGQCGSQAASMIRGISSSDNFIGKVVDGLKQHGRKNRVAANKLTATLLSSLVPYLLDALSEEPEASKRKFMITLLSSVRSDALHEIARRLHDSRWYVSRNMLLLLRECKGGYYTADIRDFLNHEVPAVQLEALRTLLSFQDSEAESYVVKFLRSNNVRLQRGAVGLAGAYRIREAVPHLVGFLREKNVINKGFLFKKSVVRALGRIGDGSKLGQLLDICRSSGLAPRDDHDKLKIEIYKTLHSYPAARLRPLIDYGMQSGIGEVVSLSGRLMEYYTRSTGRGK